MELTNSFPPSVPRLSRRCCSWPGLGRGWAYAHAGIVTHITFRELADLLDDVQAFNGFGNRFLWVCARRQKKVPFPARMPEAELSAIRHDLFNAVALAYGRGVVSLDARAREMWAAVYSDLSMDHPGLSGCIINRGEAQALRLALIYALLDGQPMIGEPHLRAGLAFWDYCKTSALYVFGGRESCPVADKILAALKDGPKTTTDLHRVMGNNATKNKIKDALQSLLASGRIIQTEEKTASKPRKNYSLNEKYEVNEFLKVLVRLLNRPRKIIRIIRIVRQGVRKIAASGPARPRWRYERGQDHH